jgi:hypothetical protein
MSAAQAVQSAPSSSPLRVAVIGGLSRSTYLWQRAAEDAGIEIEHHDGRTAGRRAQGLAALVRRADVVVIQTELNSHNGVATARRLAAAHARPHLLIRRLRPDGISELLAEARSLQRAARTSPAQLVAKQ